MRDGVVEVRGTGVEVKTLAAFAIKGIVAVDIAPPFQRIVKKFKCARHPCPNSQTVEFTRRSDLKAIH